MSAIEPTTEQIGDFLSADMTEPVCMVNLLKFKPIATYDADTLEAGQNLTGEQAYFHYAEGVVQVFSKIGARVIFGAPVQRFMIGDGDWDMSALVWYPTRQAFIDLMQRPDYEAIHYHREAALEHQVLIETTPGKL